MQCLRSAWRYLVRAVSAAAMLLILTTLRDASAYEVLTHEKLTLAALQDSILADATRGPLSALDIDDFHEARFWSIIPVGPEVRLVDSHFDSQFASAAGLIGLGAIYQDHPQHDLPFMRHFFDPQQNGKGLLGFIASPIWINEPAGSRTIEAQNFSLADARDYYLQALAFPTREDREHSTILLLQSMGHAVHHLQDMAQPAHVRDDAHPPFFDNDEYEAYTEQKFVFGNQALPQGGGCGEASIDLHRFDQAMKFWENEGAGIAEFTSSNFLSKDTVFRRAPTPPHDWTTDGVHPRPAFPANPVFDEPTAVDLAIQAPIPASRFKFLVLPIVDAMSGDGCSNTRAAALTYSSRWSSSANMPFLVPEFQTNRFTYEGNYRILFPRAIAYSTGLLNYFFRGRMELVSYAVVNAEVQVVIRNVSAAEFPLARSPGLGLEEFSLYYDARDGQRRESPLQNADLTTAVIAHGETYSLSFPLPADIDPSIEKPFTLVFDGTIGEEPGVAAVKIGSTPETFLVTPNYVPVDGIGGTRLITRTPGAWEVSPTANARAGNIDWRGHSADDVLTWDGPQGRYFGTSINSPNIYHGGRVLAVAPDTVIGAAISARGAQRYLIAATNENGTLRIYRRPFQVSYARHGLFDALNNPLGWQLIHSQFISPSTPMFFNASGNEGQVFGGPNVRFRARLAGTSVSVVQLSNVGSFTRTLDRTIDRNGSADLNPPGLPFECRAPNTTCVSARGTCTVPGGPTFSNVCLVSESHEDTIDSTITEARITRENVTRTVVCADYRGDTEVLCMVEADETPDIGLEDSSAHWNANRILTTNQSCGITPSGPAQYRHSYNYNETHSTKMQFRLGGIVIPLSGSLYQREKHYESVASWNYGNPPAEPTVSYVFSDLTTDYDTKLLYADARNGIVAYEDNQRVTRAVGSGGAPALQRSPPGLAYTFDAQVGRSISSTSRTVVHADREYLVSSRTTEGESSAIIYSENAGFSSTSIEHCSDFAPRIEHYVDTIQSEPTSFYAGSLHQMIYQPVTQSLSAISSDRFVASFPIWIRQPNASYIREGTWNFLSDGSLGTLLPNAPASATYVRTGIVR